VALDPERDPNGQQRRADFVANKGEAKSPPEVERFEVALDTFV